MRCRAALMEARCARIVKYHPARLVPRLAAPPIPGGETWKRRSSLGFSRQDKTNLDSSGIRNRRDIRPLEPVEAMIGKMLRHGCFVRIDPFRNDRCAVLRFVRLVEGTGHLDRRHIQYRTGNGSCGVSTSLGKCPRTYN